MEIYFSRKCGTPMVIHHRVKDHDTISSPWALNPGPYHNDPKAADYPLKSHCRSNLRTAYNFGQESNLTTSNQFEVDNTKKKLVFRSFQHH